MITVKYFKQVYIGDRIIDSQLIISQVYTHSTYALYNDYITSYLEDYIELCNKEHKLLDGKYNYVLHKEVIISDNLLECLASIGKLYHNKLDTINNIVDSRNKMIKLSNKANNRPIDEDLIPFEEDKHSKPVL